MPIFSAAWWKGRDFDASTLEAPLGSGAYKVGTFEQGRFIEFELERRLLGPRTCRSTSARTISRRLRFEYYRERQVAFEAFKAGAINFHQEYTSRIWATGYDFPAVQRRARQARRRCTTARRPASQALVFQHCAASSSRTRACARRSALAFDFEWTNKNVMYSSYKRVDVAISRTSAMEAKGPPGPEELALLEPLRGKVPDDGVRRTLSCRRSPTARAATARC